MPLTSSSGAAPITLRARRWTGYITVRSILDPGSGARLPTVLHPSSLVAWPTLLVPDQPRAAIIVFCQAGVDDDRGLSAVCTARE